jgi:hypothetical protein
MTFIAEDLAVTTNTDGNRLQTIASRLRKHLQKIAERRVPITYQELAKALGLTPPNTIHQVAEALEHLMAEDAATARPFIAAIAISKARGGLPAPGFFDCAARLGRFAGDATGQDAWVFHAAELNAVLAFWAPPSDSRGSEERRMASHSTQSLKQSRLQLVPGGGVDGQRPRVVIVGAGFAGLSVSKRLAKSPVDITLIDRQKSSPLSAAAIPGGDGRTVAGRHRLAYSRSGPRPAQHKRAAGRGHRGRSCAQTRNHGGPQH